MRVLIAHSSYRRAGGEDTYVRRQVELLRLAHEVELLGRSNLTLTGGLATAAQMLWSPALRREVEQTIDRVAPDVVHLHNAYPSLGPAVHLAAASRSVPLVMTVHNARLRCPNGLMFTQGAPCRRCEGGSYGSAMVHGCFPSRGQAAAYALTLWLHRFPLALERRVAAFVAPSRFMAGQLVRWGVPADRVWTIPNFTPLPPDASAEPGHYGLYLGRLATEKGVDVLVRALAAAGDPPFRIAGTGPAEDRLRRLAGELRLRNTDFLGHLDPTGLAVVLMQARFVALPSLWMENAPMAALEAMAAGRPLVVSTMGGLPELVGDGAGVSCPPGDVAGLAERIGELMDDDARCRDTGARALAYAESHLRPELHLRRLEELYERAGRLAATAWADG